jgi:hypothetical protein
LNPNEAEFFLRLAKLQNQLASDARRSVWQTIGAIFAAFVLGFVLGHAVWR